MKTIKTLCITVLTSREIAVLGALGLTIDSDIRDLAKISSSRLSETMAEMQNCGRQTVSNIYAVWAACIYFSSDVDHDRRD